MKSKRDGETTTADCDWSVFMFIMNICMYIYFFYIYIFMSVSVCTGHHKSVRQLILCGNNCFQNSNTPIPHLHVEKLHKHTHTQTCSNSNLVHGDTKDTHGYSWWGLTSREGQLDLLINDFQGDEVVFLVEPAVVQEQGVSFSGCKPANINISWLFIFSSRPTASTAHVELAPVKPTPWIPVVFLF